MSISSVVTASRTALLTIGEQTGIVSRNIANASDPDASRKVVELVSAPGGGVAVGRISRVVDEALFNSSLDLDGRAARSGVVTDALNRLDGLFSDPADGRSPAALIGKLRDSLSTFSSQPDSVVLASSVVAAATSLAGSLDYMTSQVQALRQDMDREIAGSVGSINEALRSIHELNPKIIEASRVGRDATDLLDQRDQALRAIANEIDITWEVRADNDIRISTSTGLTLYDRVPRAVTFEPSGFLSATRDGNAVIVDGVAVSGPGSPLPVSGGRLAGLIEVRDQIAPSAQDKLDEIARGLIEAFSESDQSAMPALPDRAGLLTWPGGPDLPPAGTIERGLAGLIQVNPSLAAGGTQTADLLRNGGISDPGNPAYNYNPSGAASFADRALELVARLEESQPFDPVAGLDASADVISFSVSMAGWLGDMRARASQESVNLDTSAERARLALSNATGVNLDEELAHMLQLERSYQASARLMTVADDMLAYLIESVR
jgi:flagellar hook-associated protein 1 FlgK